MATTVTRRFGTVPRKEPRSLNLRMAQRLGVAEKTIDAWRFGHEPGRPQTRVAGMLEVCYEAGALKEAEAILTPIEIAKQQVLIPEFSVRLQADTQYADATEDRLEAAFNANPCRPTYLPWRRAMLDEVAKLQRLVISGDNRFLA